MSAAKRAEMIRQRLTVALGPQQLEVIDESHRHSGHAGAADGRSHFRVRIVAARFEGLERLQRHRLVYAALGELMRSDIHALAIDALSPGEAPAQ